MRIHTAVILAGGLGTRLRPLTENTPKGMIKVCGKPLLEWIIEWLADYQVNHIVLGVTHLKEKIVEHFGDGRQFNVDIKYSVHTIKGGTGEGFRLAITRHVEENVFFAMNGDQLTDLNLSRLADFHFRHDAIATIAVNHPRCPYGQIRADEEGNILRFIEKPSCPHALCNTGIYVFNREILQYLPEKGSVEKTTFPALAKMHRLKAYPFRGFFSTVNTQKDLVEAERKLRRRIK